MFHDLIFSVALGERNGELKLMMSGNFDRVQIISVGSVVHIDERYIVAVDLLEAETHRELVAVCRQIDVVEHVGELVIGPILLEVQPSEALSFFSKGARHLVIHRL